MTPLEQEITELSERWMRYVGMDHHKDKDCHWYVQKYYSYGEPPYYQAFHWGYIGSNFEGTKCTTLEEAEEELRDNLLFQIHIEKQYTKRNIEDSKKADPNGEWYDYIQSMLPEYEQMLKYLDGDFND